MRASSLTATLRRWLPVATVATLVVGAIGTPIAQQPTPTPLLDGRGLPLPFGVPAVPCKPDFPLGSGPFKAVMSVEPGLSEHVVYAPANLSALKAKKLPVVIWGNGSCLYAGNRYRSFLTEVASHGYLVIAGGPMGAVELEVGPQSNPAPRQGGAGGGRGGGQPAPAATVPSVGQASQGRGPGDATGAQGRVTVALLKAAVDWATQQQSDASSRFYRALDLAHIVSMGHSCGGGLAVQLATEDARINGLGIWFSGAGLVGARGNDPSSLLKIKGPVLIITGEEGLDTAYASGKASFEAINHVPVWYGWQDKLQHIGTFGARNGGDLGVIAVRWLDWTTRSDAAASRMFKGAACTLCKDATWHVLRKKIN